MECNGHFLRRFDKCTVRVSYYTKVKFTYFADCHYRIPKSGTSSKTNIKKCYECYFRRQNHELVAMKGNFWSRLDKTAE